MVARISDHQERRARPADLAMVDAVLVADAVLPDSHAPPLYQDARAVPVPSYHRSRRWLVRLVPGAPYSLARPRLHCHERGGFRAAAAGAALLGQDLRRGPPAVRCLQPHIDAAG